MKTQDGKRFSFYEAAVRPIHLLDSMKAVYLKADSENLSLEALQAAQYLRKLKSYYDGAPVFFEDMVEKLTIDYWTDSAYHDEEATIFDWKECS